MTESAIQAKLGAMKSPTNKAAVAARVLVVDDEKSIRTSMQLFLQSDGYEVVVAENAQCAIGLMRENSFDVVITDIMMPGISGVELLRLLRENSPDVPVLLMTGDPSVQTAVDALRAGATDYLLKPIRHHDVLRTIKQAVDLKRMRDRNHELELQNLAYRENLEEMVSQRTAMLDQTVKGVIEAMSVAVEFRDPYTAGHERNVARLSLAIARKMGRGQPFQETVYFAGMLHDLGKISVPAEVLSYPGKLLPEYMAIVRKHPETAYEILRKVQFPWPLAEVVRQHHERLDGSGYPLGLVGDQIRAAARVLAVADVVESMASRRPYRDSLGLEQALDEIRAHAGHLYDEGVVQACIALFEEDGYQLENSEEICL